jgi:SH3-like domain-containing protein
VQLPLPRFVTIKSSEANIRTGPNVRYPIRWVFVRKGEPVELSAEFEQWRKIRDKYGDDGWIHESMLSGKRGAIIIGDMPVMLQQKPDESSIKLVKLEPELRVELIACHKDWCNIQVKNYKGWIKVSNIWGIYPQEEVK